MFTRFTKLFLYAAACSVCLCHTLQAQEQRIIEVSFVPTKRLQLAVWIAKEDGTFLRTLALTESVARYGLGNRPGASQMNSGFRWPYGRREQLLPVWAYSRAHAPGAQLFKRVIFQNRTSEGFASRTADDYSHDNHYCVSFSQANNNVDVMSCASVTNTDKGRYITEQDISAKYSEPVQNGAGPNGSQRALDLFSLYPPRRDLDALCKGVGCYDHPDIIDYQAHAKNVMPEIDAVSMATPPAQSMYSTSFTVPSDWPDGTYKIWVEAHQEADFNDCFSASGNPTPMQPEGAWDYWAKSLGYPFRGQPSVVYELDVTIGANELNEVKVRDPIGMSSWEMLSMQTMPMQALSNCMANNANATPGSGADRLLLQSNDWRVKVRARELDCTKLPSPSAVENVTLAPYPDRKQAHQWARLSFKAPNVEDATQYSYTIKLSRTPIVDDESFTNALPAYAASAENEAAHVPPTGAGQEAIVDLGGLLPQTRYYVAVRARDVCNKESAIQAAEIETKGVEYTTVKPCFVATAAYGNAAHADVRWLRHVRDQHLQRFALGRAFIAWYEKYGPIAAQYVLDHPWLQPVAKSLLRPFILVTYWLLS